jgi:VWFA-related protein
MESPAIEAIPAAVTPERFVAYLFDDVHVKTNDLIMARDAAYRHMKRALRAKTRAAIFTTSGETMLDFTSDRDQLHEALFRLQPRPVAQDASGHDCPDLTYLWAQAIKNGDSGAYMLAIAAAAACSSMPKKEAALLVPPVVARVIARTEHETGVTLDVLRDLIRRMAVLPGQRTIVLASPGFMTEFGSKEAESFIIDRAIRAKVVINALDVRGLYVDTRDLSLPSNEADIKAPFERAENIARMDVMAELANGTGGTFYHNSNDMDAGFDRVAGNPEYRYVLGFSPEGLKPDGSLHALTVSIIPNPHHYDLDARRSYTAPKRLDDPVEAAREEITAAIFSREEMRDIPLELHTEFFKTRNQAKLTVVTHVDLKALKLPKTEGRNHDDLTVTTGIFDTNGNYVAGIQRGVELRLKDETFDKWMANGIQVRSNLEVKPGTYLVRVVVRDSEGHLMAARNGSVNIP